MTGERTILSTMKFSQNAFSCFVENKFFQKFFNFNCNSEDEVHSASIVRFIGNLLN